MQRKRDRGINVGKRYTLLSAIPVFPKEKDARTLGRECGFEITNLFGSLSEQVMICEDAGRYCWLDAKSKRRELAYLRRSNNGRRIQAS